MLTPALLDIIRQTRVIVTHDNCADGTVSAMLLQNALPTAKVVFVQHGTDAFKNLAVEPHMLFCDIAPPAERASEFKEAGAVVLDHHRTAWTVVQSFGDMGVFADESVEPGVSGAVLAYRVWDALTEFCGPAFREWVCHFATLTGIRDTWQNQSPLWGEACRQAQLLHLVPNNLWLGWSLVDLAENWESQFDWLADVLTERHKKSVERSIGRGARFTSEKGTRVILFASLSNTSDAAEILGDSVDLVAGFSYEQDNGVNKLIYSTRSHTDFDCAAFCKAQGGGGHTRAAGFSLGDDGGPYQTFMRLLNAYESR